MKTVFTSQEIEAELAIAKGHIIQANRRALHPVEFAGWRLDMTAAYARLILTYTDGDREEMEHSIAM